MGRFKFSIPVEEIPDDGIFNFDIGYPKTETNIYRKPLDYQSRFHKSKAKYRLMSGGFGTGGTTALSIEMAYQLLTYPNNVGLLGRFDSVELEATTLAEFLEVIPAPTIRDTIHRSVYYTFGMDQNLSIWV